MIDYKIVFSALDAYMVEVRSAPGSFLSVRGFATEIDAQAWIVEQKLGDADAENRPA